MLFRAPDRDVLFEAGVGKVQIPQQTTLRFNGVSGACLGHEFCDRLQLTIIEFGDPPMHENRVRVSKDRCGSVVALRAVKVADGAVVVQYMRHADDSGL
jgi:hypothetical protein